MLAVLKMVSGIIIVLNVYLITTYEQVYCFANIQLQSESTMLKVERKIMQGHRRKNINGLVLCHNTITYHSIDLSSLLI